MTIGFTHPGTGLGTRVRMMGSRNTVPPKILRICADLVVSNSTEGAIPWTHSSVRAPPHLLKLELLHSRFVRRDGRTFDANFVLEDSVSCVDCNLVIGLPGKY